MKTASVAPCGAAGSPPTTPQPEKELERGLTDIEGAQSRAAADALARLEHQRQQQEQPASAKEHALPAHGIDLVLRRQRLQWHQRHQPQLLQNGPWRKHNIASGEAAVLVNFAAPALLSGRTVTLPVPSLPPFDDRGHGCSRPRREDGGRWPLAPPVHASLSSPHSAIGAPIHPTPNAPAGQCTYDNARFMGIRYVASLSPRVHVEPCSPAVRRPQPYVKNDLVERPPRSLAVALLDSDRQLGLFLGGASTLPHAPPLTLPSVGMAPPFDPRRMLKPRGDTSARCSGGGGSSSPVSRPRSSRSAGAKRYR